jgi:rhodanese-related sulfurtransferase
MNSDLPPRPANMENIVAINQGRRPLTMGRREVRELSTESCESLIDGGCLVLDIRPFADYTSGHIPGTYNVDVESGQFEQNVGWIMPPDEPFLLAGDSPDAIRLALYKLAFVGLDSRVAGCLPLAAWKRGRLSQVPEIEVGTLFERMRLDPIGVLDVRARAEFETGHIDSAVNADFKLLPGMVDSLPFACDQHLAVLCAGGARSVTACGILLREGFSKVYNVPGGMTAWQEARLPVLSAS